MYSAFLCVSLIFVLSVGIRKSFILEFFLSMTSKLVSFQFVPIFPRNRKYVLNCFIQEDFLIFFFSTKQILKLIKKRKELLLNRHLPTSLTRQRSRKKITKVSTYLPSLIFHKIQW